MREKLEKLLDRYVGSDEISGASVLLYKDGREYLSLQKGYADTMAGIPYSNDTLIRLYSMTKPITSAAVMILIERGLLERLDPVSDFIPSFASQRYYAPDGSKKPVSRPMTIGDLLDMTGGMSYPDESTPAGADAGLVFRDIEERLGTKNEMTTQEVAYALGSCTLAFDPGTDYLYSTCADILGAVVEKVSGMKFSLFLKKEIFDPLGMEDTGFMVPRDRQDRLARSYVPASHMFNTPSNERPYTDDSHEYTGNNLGILSRMDTAPAFESGGAGLVSTLNDYMKFAQMLLNGGSADGHRILSPSTIEFMTTHRCSSVAEEGFHKRFELDGFSYGNLLRIGVSPELCDTLMSRGEYGWDGWLGPYFANLPDLNATLLIAMQRTNSGTFSLTRRIRNIVLAQI